MCSILLLIPIFLNNLNNKIFNRFKQLVVEYNAIFAYNLNLIKISLWFNTFDMCILLKWRGHRSIFIRFHVKKKFTKNMDRTFRFVLYTILRPVYFHRMGTKRANEKANESFVYTAKTEHAVL